MRYIYLLVLSLISGGAWAQTLHAELDIDKEVEPIDIEVNKLSISPKIILPAITTPKLRYSDKIVTTRVSDETETISPVMWEEMTGYWPFKGYVQGCFFPRWNMRLSAGYRILNDARTQLNVWGRYKGNVYKKEYEDLPTPGKLWWRNQDGRLGVQLNKLIGTQSELDVVLKGGYGHHTTSWFIFDREPLSAYNGSLQATFYSQVGDMKYAIGGEYDYSKYKLRNNPSFDAQNIAKLTGDFSSAINDRSEVGVNLLLGMLHQNGSHGLISMSPRYNYKSSQFQIKAGINANVMIKEDKKFFVAPDVTLGFTPSSFLAISFRGTGGVDMNGYGKFYENLPSLMPYGVFSMSRIPFNGELAILVGPFKGAWLQLAGAYARANNWYMPCSGGYENLDMRGYKFKASLGGEISDFLKISASYETTPLHNFTHGWFQWSDRARHALTLSATVTPIEKLTVTGDYRFRFKRGLYMSPEEYINLGNYAGLNANITYAWTRRFSVFIEGANLCPRNVLNASLLPGQGITALIGAQYKF